MRKLETALAIILAATATPVLAQKSAQQTGQTSKASPENVQKMTEAAFSRWDSNGDKRLRGDEFAAGLHQAWTGDNKHVDQTAFSENWDNWFSADRPDFASLDEDDNGQLSEQELRAALADANFSGPWQGADDGYLTPEEFRKGVNTVADRDRDGQLNQSEMNNVFAVISVLVPDPSSTAATTAKTSDQQAQANSGMSGTSQDPSQLRVGNVISLNEWDTEGLYQNSWSAEALFDRQVYSRDGEEIGDVEDLIIGSNGELLALIAEVGGIWDIGDTHVSVPWEQVTFRQDGTVSIPVTQDNADDFSVLNEPGAQALQQDVVSNLDDRQLGPRAWRASELIGDIARIRNDQGAMAAGSAQKQAGTQQSQAQKTQSEQRSTEQAKTGNALAPSAGNRMAYRGYGYVSDLIFNEGRVAAAVVDRDAGYGTRGRYAYPYYGYSYGWNPGSRYYDLPYDREEAVTITPFEYDRLNES
jgi:sporulation protein YlmC with PRC-barrel domain/Ca2+-binding EF-hand superfamily protein